MIKKAVLVFSTLVLTAFIAGANGVQTKAALPSTIDIINDANNNVANASAMYAQAKSTEADMLAKLNAVKADPAHTQLAYEQAVYNYSNAVNVSQWWLTQLNNSKAYLKNISDRGAFEDKFWANKAALADLTKLSAAKTDMIGAQNIANGVAAQIADVEKAIAGYQVQLAATPSLQSAIDDLNKKLVILKADLAAKQAIAAEKANLFNTYINTLNYKSYSLGFEDYQFNREYQRDNENWDPSIYNY